MSHGGVSLSCTANHDSNMEAALPRLLIQASHLGITIRFITWQQVLSLFLSFKGCVYIPQLFWCSKQNLKLENTLDSLRWTQQKCLNSSCLDLPASPLEARTIVETFCVICFSLGRIVTVRLVPAPSRVFVAKPFHREHIQRKLR